MSEQAPPENDIPVVKEEECEMMNYSLPVIKAEKLKYDPDMEIKEEESSRPLIPGTAFLCPTCGVDFYYENFFTEHVREHHTSRTVEGTDPLEEDYGVAGELPDVAGSDGASRESGEVPSQQTGEEQIADKPFSCSQCEYTCNHQGNLKKHIMMKHTEEKLFKCSECSYATCSKGNLVTHTRTHNGEKPFSCSQCDYSCSRKEYLKEHVMRKHTGERPFKCSECSYATCSNSDFVKHRRTHTGEKPFSCSQCDYSCKQKGSLKLHVMRKHTGERPFKCSECSFDTCKKGDLVIHTRTHTGEKPFSCSQCDYSCKQKANLNIHFMTKHSG